MSAKTGVYKFTCLNTGRFYIGSSQNVRRRKQRHLSALRNGRHHNVFLQRVFNKYGESSFKFQVILTDSLEEAREYEQELLDKHLPNSLCMNIGRKASGGDNLTNNPNLSKILRNKSKAMRLYFTNLGEDGRKERYGRPGKTNPMYGRTHSKEARRKMSEAHTGNTYCLGYKHDEAYRKACSERAKLRTGSKNSFYGKTHSDETKRRISEANTGSKAVNRRRVKIGRRTFDCLRDASKALGIPVPTIHYRINSNSFPDFSYLS